MRVEVSGSLCNPVPKDEPRDCRVLTASSINDIASVCNVTYSQVLSHINNCRSNQEILDRLQIFVFRYRPDLQR